MLCLASGVGFLHHVRVTVRGLKGYRSVSETHTYTKVGIGIELGTFYSTLLMCNKVGPAKDNILPYSGTHGSKTHKNVS